MVRFLLLSLWILAIGGGSAQKISGQTVYKAHHNSIRSYKNKSESRLTDEKTRLYKRLSNIACNGSDN